MFYYYLLLIVNIYFCIIYWYIICNIISSDCRLLRQDLLISLSILHGFLQLDWGLVTWSSHNASPHHDLPGSQHNIHAGLPRSKLPEAQTPSGPNCPSHALSHLSHTSLPLDLGPLVVLEFHDWGLKWHPFGVHRDEQQGRRSFGSSCPCWLEQNGSA